MTQHCRCLLAALSTRTAVYRRSKPCCHLSTASHSFTDTLAALPPFAAFSLTVAHTYADTFTRNPPLRYHRLRHCAVTSSNPLALPSLARYRFTPPLPTVMSCAIHEPHILDIAQHSHPLVLLWYLWYSLPSLSAYSAVPCQNLQLNYLTQPTASCVTFRGTPRSGYITKASQMSSQRRQRRRLGR